MSDIVLHVKMYSTSYISPTCEETETVCVTYNTDIHGL